MNKKHRSEVLLKQLLDELQIPYIDVRQDKHELPTFLKASGKRVDFIVFLRGKGVIAIDAKERNDCPERFDMDVSDAMELRTFEELTGIHTFVAFLYSPHGGNVTKWHFIDTFSIVTNYRNHVSEKNNKYFISVNGCSVTEDINMDFFNNYLNKYSEFVLIRNPNLKKKAQQDAS